MKALIGKLDPLRFDLEIAEFAVGRLLSNLVEVLPQQAGRSLSLLLPPTHLLLEVLSLLGT